MNVIKYTEDASPAISIEFPCHENLDDVELISLSHFSTSSLGPENFNLVSSTLSSLCLLGRTGELLVMTMKAFEFASNFHCCNVLVLRGNPDTFLTRH